MKSIKLLLSKTLPQLLLVVYLIKSNILPGDSNLDAVVIMALAALSGYRMYLNSVFDTKIQRQLEEYRIESLQDSTELHTANEDAIQELKDIVAVNHRDVDSALARITAANNEEFSNLKTQVGQINISKGAANGKSGQIFF